MNFLHFFGKNRILKKIILTFVLGLLILLLTARVFSIITDLKRENSIKNNQDIIHFYAMDFFAKPLGVLASKYTLQFKKKVNITFDNSAENINDAASSSCYILATKKPNIFLQNNINDSDFLPIRVKIGAIVSNNDTNINIKNIYDLIQFVQKNNLRMVLHKDNQEIQKMLVNWYMKNIITGTCKSMIKRIVPLDDYSINDITQNHGIISTQDINHEYNGYSAKISDTLYLTAKKLIPSSNVINFLHQEIDIIFVVSSEFEKIKSNLENVCTEYYTNQNFFNMLQSVESKDLTTSALASNEIGIGIADDIANYGKMIYLSTQSDNITTWFIVKGPNKKPCYDFLKFVKKNSNQLKNFGLEIGNTN